MKTRTVIAADAILGVRADEVDAACVLTLMAKRPAMVALHHTGLQAPDVGRLQ